MANKYYVYEKVTGGFEMTSASWDEVQKIPRKSVKGFKTEAEAKSYLDEKSLMLTDISVSSLSLHNTSGVKESCVGLHNIIGPSNSVPTPPTNLDAIIYCDGSFQDPGKQTSDAFCGSYGIIIFTKNGSYVETTLLTDPKNQALPEFIDNASFTEDRYKYDSTTEEFTKETSNHNFTVYNKASSYGYGMMHTGWASAAEFCGATRAIDVCLKMNFKNVMLIYDAEEVYRSCLKADAKDNTSNGSNLFKQKVLEAKAKGLNIYVDEHSKVDSHESHVYSPNEHDNYFGKYDYIFNEAVDILAKIQLIDQPIFNSKKKNENRNIYAELLPQHSDLINNMKEVNELADRTDALKYAAEFVKVIKNIKHPYFM